MKDSLARVRTNVDIGATDGEVPIQSNNVNASSVCTSYSSFLLFQFFLLCKLDIGNPAGLPIPPS